MRASKYSEHNELKKASDALKNKESEFRLK